MKDQWIWRESNKMTREEKDEKERWKKEEQVSVIHVEKKNNNKHTAWNICNWSPKRSRKRLGQKNNVWRNNAEMFQTLWKQKHRSKKLKESKAKKTIPRYIIVNLSKIKAKEKDIPGGSEVKSPPANAGDTSLTPDLGRIYISPWFGKNLWGS